MVQRKTQGEIQIQKETQVKIILSFLVFCFIACTPKVKKEVKTPVKLTPPEPLPVVNDTFCFQEQLLLDSGLVNIQEVNPSIQVELRYADTNNFLHIKLYPCLKKAFLQKEVAQMLDSAQRILSRKKPGYKLYVWDAVRPKSVQQMMWDSLKMPLNQKFRYVSNPKNHSVHNYGAAVDLTIQDSMGNLLDMGTDFDYFGAAANVNIDSLNLANEVLTKGNIKNRWLLRRTMFQAGFRGINSEWWHFNAFSRAEVKKRYSVIE